MEEIAAIMDCQVSTVKARMFHARVKLRNLLPVLAGGSVGAHEAELGRTKMNNPHRAEGDHRRAWDVIPWVVNGSASVSEQRLIDEHVQVCADCRLELARQRRLQSAVAQEVNPVTDVDAGLKRLFKRIDESTDHRIAATPGGGLARRGWHGMAVINHWLVAAVVVEAMGLSALGVALVLRGASEPEYQTLTEAAAAPKRATILIVPAPSMRIDELQRQLHALNLPVVSGPNAVGAYELAPKDDQPAHEPQISSLRADPRHAAGRADRRCRARPRVKLLALLAAIRALARRLRSPPAALPSTPSDWTPCAITPSG